MAEHVFESPLVEEFYNSCHYKANGKFCGTGTKGKVAKRVLMSDAARASNAAIRGKSAKMRKKIAAKQAQSKGALSKMSKSSSKIVKTKSKYRSASEQSGGTSGSKYKNVPDTQPGTGMRPVSALTLKYGTRRR